MEIHIAHLKSYGFIHPGKERWRRTIKRCWDLIPGSTLYGAVADALIRLDCDDKGPSKERCMPPQENKQKSLPCADCGYAALLREIENKNIRFSPLVPSEKSINTALDYCRAAGELSDLVTNPHVVINRFTESAQEELLFGVQTHEPFVDYYSFVISGEEFLPHLNRALRCLPISPFGGGQGKFTTVEGKIEASVSEEKFMEEFLKQVDEETYLKLLTPMITGTPENFLLENAKEISACRVKRYRVWRTGLYKKDGNWKRYGTPGNEQTAATMGIPEGAQFILDIPKDDFSGIFLRGIGNPDWTYLGWGQVIVDV